MKSELRLRTLDLSRIAAFFLCTLKTYCAFVFSFIAGIASAQIAITSVGTAFNQNFDTLPTTGAITWLNNVTLPGWYFQRTGAGTTITAGTGSSATGGLYSFGTGTATERSLGAVSSGATGNVFYGVRLLNQTGTTITSLRVSYVGEQWRRAATTAPVAQTVNFSYVTGSPTTGSLAEFQSVGTTVSQLDFTSPITALPAGALDGNAAANRVARSHTITGLSLANNSEIFLRWSDIDHPDFDHGLAIDDFSFTALSETNLTVSVSDAPDPVIAGSNIAYTITANNLGPNAAPNAILTTSVPAASTFVSIVAPTGWACTAPLVGATGAISCSAASFASTTSAQIDLVVQVAPSTLGGTSISGNFVLNSDLVDTVPGNDAAATSTLVTALIFDVTPSAGAGGTISPSLAQSVPYNGATVFIVTPNPGFSSSVGGTCGGALVGTTYTTNAVAANCTVDVTFTPIIYAVTPSAGANGSISPTTSQNVNSGSSAVFTVTPNPGYSATVGGSCGGTLVGTTYTTNLVTANCSVAATFAPIIYVVTPSAGANGSISPTTTQNVNSGSSAVFTVTPNPGYSATVGGSCGGTLIGTTYTTNAITANCNVSASFAQIVYVVTPSAGANGSISPTTTQNVNSGSSAVFTVTPNPGYTATVGGSCGGTLIGTTYTTNAITANCTVSASFAQIVYVVTPSAGVNGSISPTTTQNVNSGSNASFTVTPNAGFSANVGGTCGGNLVGTTYTTNSVAANCTVVARFSPIVLIVTPSAGTNGSISPAIAQNVNSGATTTFTVSPNAGYTATMGGTCGGALAGNTFTTNAITASCTVIVSFAPIVYLVTPSVGANGTISPSTPQNVNSGATAVFTLTPDAGYVANAAGTCPGALVGATFTTNAITANCTVAATFSRIPLIPQTITNFSPPAALTLVTGATFTLSATGGASNNPVVFSSTSPTVCTVSGTTVTVVGLGACQILASQAGNAQFEAANSVSVTVQINAAAREEATPVPALNAWSLFLLILSVVIVSLRRNTRVR